MITISTDEYWEPTDFDVEYTKDEALNAMYNDHVDPIDYTPEKFQAFVEAYSNLFLGFMRNCNIHYKPNDVLS